MRGFDSRHPLKRSGRRSQVVRQSSAKAPPPVRFWASPPIVLLVAAFLATALAGPLIGVRQLDAASGAQVRLAHARSDLDALLQIQLAEETSLRGFMSTRNPTFLDVDKPPNPAFGRQARALEEGLRTAAIPNAVATVEDMRQRHDEWERTVALPLLRNPDSREAYAQQSQGKFLTDRMSDDAANLRRELTAASDRVEGTLRRRINATVAISAGIITLFAIIALWYAIGRATAVARLAPLQPALHRHVRGRGPDGVRGAVPRRVRRAHADAPLRERRARHRVRAPRHADRAAAADRADRRDRPRRTVRHRDGPARARRSGAARDGRAGRGAQHRRRDARRGAGRRAAARRALRPAGTVRPAGGRRRRLQRRRAGRSCDRRAARRARGGDRDQRLQPDRRERERVRTPRPDGEGGRVVLARRIVPCLDIKDGRVVKGVRFLDLSDAGDPVALARRYEAEGADELVFLDITATVEGRRATLAVVRAAAAGLTIPFAVGRGVAGVEHVNDLLRAGCDKVSVNSAAVRDPDIVRAASRRFGAQCIVVAIDARRSPNAPSGFEVVVDGGRTATGRDAVAWAAECERLGAGELLVTSIDRDGTRAGFDIPLLRAIREACNLPVIASGGAGTVQHFVDVFRDADADAALAASLFHYAELAIDDLKAALAREGIVVRRETVAV